MKNKTTKPKVEEIENVEKVEAQTESESKEEVKVSETLEVSESQEKLTLSKEQLEQARESTPKATKKPRVEQTVIDRSKRHSVEEKISEEDKALMDKVMAYFGYTRKSGLHFDYFVGGKKPIKNTYYEKELVEVFKR